MILSGNPSLPILSDECIAMVGFADSIAIPPPSLCRLHAADLIIG
jgi:hypothetical protein